MKMVVRHVKRVGILLADKWYYFKQRFFKKDYEKFLKKIINKQLKPYKVTYDYVKNNPKIEGEDWWYYYTFNREKDYLKWKKYTIKQIKKYYPYLNDKKVLQQFGLIDLMWGLRHNY